MIDIKQIEDFAKKCHDEKEFAHGWPHIQAVKKRAFELAKNFNVDKELLEIAVLLHDCDYSDPKMHVENSAQKAGEFLDSINHPKDKIEKIKQIILAHATHIREKVGDTKLIEGKILFDSDKMECISPKGVLRVIFSYLNLPLSQLIKELRRVSVNFFDKLYLKESKDMIKDDHKITKMFIENIEREIGE